jgi:uncharacterized protein YqeY
MLKDTLKARANDAMKARDAATAQLLRLVIGELQTLEARLARDPSDDEAFAVVKKLIKSNEETLSLTTDDTQKKVLETEVALLRSLLPKGLDVAAIVALLEPVRDAIVGAKADGQATGVAMKHIKAQGANADSADVMAAVKAIRTP